MELRLPRCVAGISSIAPPRIRVLLRIGLGPIEYVAIHDRPPYRAAAFPDIPVGSACTSVFSRLARRSLTLRSEHAHGHQVATAIQRLQTFRYLHACSGCFRLERMPGGTSLESAALPGARDMQPTQIAISGDRLNG